MAVGQSGGEPSFVEPIAPSESGPTVLRIALGAQLRRLREASGVTREDAGYAIRASHAKISRLELGRVGYKERDVADLLTLYGVHDQARREAFLDLARQANSPGWWHQYNDVVQNWFELYVGLEQAASVIRTYEVQFLPGLLQTRDTTRAILLAGHLESAEEVERRVDLRMRRQEVLTRPDPLSLWAVVDESALRRPVDGRQIMADQLRHLLELSDLPNITIQALRYDSRGHASANGPFSILRFEAGDLPDVVYLEQLTSALYLDKPADVDFYRAAMSRLSVRAESPEKTQSLLLEMMKGQ